MDADRRGLQTEQILISCCPFEFNLHKSAFICGQISLCLRVSVADCLTASRPLATQRNSPESACDKFAVLLSDRLQASPKKCFQRMSADSDRKAETNSTAPE